MARWTCLTSVITKIIIWRTQQKAWERVHHEVTHRKSTVSEQRTPVVNTVHVHGGVWVETGSRRECETAEEKKSQENSVSSAGVWAAAPAIQSWEEKKDYLNHRVRLTWDAPTCRPQAIQLFICKRPVNSNFVTWINRCDVRGGLELQVCHAIVEGAAWSLTWFLLCCDWVCCCASASETLWLAELLVGKCSASLMFKQPVRQHPGEMNHWSRPE